MVTDLSVKFLCVVHSVLEIDVSACCSYRKTDVAMIRTECFESYDV